MKREILFRGLRKYGEGFVYGSLVVHNQLECSIIDYASYEKESYNWNDVIPESVGQFTGLKDKNGIKIFEGDVILVNYDSHKLKETVIFNNGAFKKSYLGDNNEVHLINFTPKSSQNIEVIGNIHS